MRMLNFCTILLALINQKVEKHKESQRAQAKTRYEANPEKYRQRTAAWVKKNPERARAATKDWKEKNPETRNVRTRERNTGFTPKIFAARFSAQDGKCAICTESFTKTPSADHKHSEPKIPRGLLCNLCNTGLGMFKDKRENLVRGIAYYDLYPDNASEGANR